MKSSLSFRLFHCLLGSALCFSAVAVQAQAPRPTRKEKMALFADLAGTWDIVVEQRNQAGQRVEYRGTRVHTPVLDGIGIRVERDDQLVHADPDFSHFSARSASISYMTFNPNNGLYEICDVFSTIPNRMIVTLNPLTYVYSWEYLDPRTGATVEARSKNWFESKDELRCEILFTGTDGTERIYRATMKRRLSVP